MGGQTTLSKFLFWTRNPTWRALRGRTWQKGPAELAVCSNTCPGPVFFCFLHTVSWDEMSWASFSCSHEHMLTVSSVWVFLFYRSPISFEMGSPWAWDRNHGLFCVPTLPVCSARLIYIIFLNEASARDVGYITSLSTTCQHIMEDWSRDCELLLVEILERGSFWGCGRVWEGSSKGKGGMGREEGKDLRERTQQEGWRTTSQSGLAGDISTYGPWHCVDTHQSVGYRENLLVTRQ